MKTSLLIVLLLLLFGQVSCRKNKSAEPTNSNRATGVTDAAGDRSAARVYLQQGKEFYRNDEDTRAVEAFQQAIKLDPDLAEAHFRLGLAYDATGQEKEAEE